MLIECENLVNFLQGMICMYGFDKNKRFYFLKKRAARCTSIPRSRRVRGRAAPQGVNCRQPNLTLSVADSTARTRDLLVTRRQPYRCSKAPLPSPTHKNKENKIKHKTYKIDTYIHKQTHSPKNTISPKQKQDHTYIQTNTTKNM